MSARARMLPEMIGLCCHEMFFKYAGPEPGQQAGDRLRLRGVKASRRVRMPLRGERTSGPTSKSSARQAKRSPRAMVSITSILIILSHSVPSIKEANCFQLMSSPSSKFGQRHQQASTLQLPFDVSQLPTLSSDTANLLPMEAGELPGEQIDWARTNTKFQAPPPPIPRQSPLIQPDLTFASASQQEAAFEANHQLDDGLFSSTNEQASVPRAPLIMPKLANLLIASDAQPSALKNLIDSTLPQTNLGRAIEATRMFVRQQHEIAAAAPPRLPLIQLPGTVSNRLYNFLFQPRAQQQSAGSLPRELTVNQPASRKQNGSDTSELIQPAESQEWGEKQRSLVTLSAPYEERTRKILDSESMLKTKPSKSVNLMSSASGRYSFATAFARPNTTATTSWRQASSDSSPDDELVPNVNETLMMDSIDPQQAELRPQQQFVVGSEESEGGQQEAEQQQQQQVSSHFQNQDQANAEFQASLQSSQPEEEGNQAAQMEQQSADQPQELASYIEQPQQQQHQQLVEMDSGGSPGEPNQENQRIEYGKAESVYLTPGHQRYTSNNLTTSILVPINETDLSPNSVASLQGDDASLAAQLPSQYDSMIRLPPDGHYDDYFKLGGAGNPSGNSNLFASEQLTSDTSSLLSHQDTSNLQAQEFFTQYNVVNANQNHTQRQQDQSASSRFNVDTNQQPIRTNFQSTVLANNAKPLDYTIQYYMNQQPLKMGGQEVRQGKTIEFVTSNQSNMTHHELPNYKLHQAAEPQRHMRSKQNRPITSGSSFNSTTLTDQVSQRQPSNNATDEYQQVQSDGSVTGQQLVVHNGQYQLWNYSTTPAPEVNQTEDSIQLIVANSNSLQDPNTNERVITYSSEGRNFTQPNGKSARNTFFNKDLNEIPPDQKNSESITNNTENIQTHELMLQIRPKLRSTRSPSVEDNPNNHRVVVLLNKQPPQEHQQQQYRLVATTTQAPPTSGTERTGSDGDEQEDEGNGYSGSDQDGHEVMAHPGQFAQFGERQHHEPAKPKQTQQQERSEEKPHGTRHGSRSRDYEQQQARGARTYRSKTPPQTSGGSDRMHRHHNRFKNTKHALKQQQTVRRPQVTEARFQLKDLALNAPTAMPSVTESTIRSIETLPTKVKQVREKQVDKNELMNELLTALDRVKAAIYKLQPLTAKMNAMYRKSVTSNTRDHIMDNHKGTYSKRYPPGDYDDSYDRMHPSELIDRQRDQQRSSRRRRSRNNSRADDVQTSDSKITAVYLPAPRDFHANSSTPTSLKSTFQKRDNSSQFSHEAKAFFVTSGVGQRLGPNGQKLQGRLSFKTATGGQQIIYDYDEDNALEGLNFEDFRLGRDAASNDTNMNQSFTRRNGSQLLESPATRPLDDQEVQSPLFGYKITIYQSPDDGDGATDDTDRAPSDQNQLLSYTLVSDPTSSELSFNTEADSDPAYELAGSGEESNESNGEGSSEPEGMDLMATSESSLAPMRTEDMDESESSKKKKKLGMKEEKKHKKAMEEEEAHKKKDKKEKGEKKGNKWAKHQAKHKKGEEEHKKKKEFKKIKHSKGVMSKESHKLHRDKHIKAHDRGAAKEKALKERTQIEFFEREQIVDDEFEKGKKSSMKAGWASGHDAKKVDKELHEGGHGGDSMSMGGSHYVKHVETPPPGMMTSAREHGDGGYLEKGHGSSLETSSGKQSNKFEKKHMKAKGKKFKGWREKGYKIITETEFIDRGSLHDSAYKKRDKGAAHHQKFKKHEANSEGHHGSMHEHHKKSHKKEEKKSKMEEKKKEMMGKEGTEKAKRHKKHKKKEMGDKKHKHHEEKEHHGDHDQEESSPTMASVDDPSSGQFYTVDQYDEPNDNENLQPEKLDTRLMNTSGASQTQTSAMLSGSSTLRPTVLPLPMTSTRVNQPATMMRFLPTDHQDQSQRRQIPEARDGSNRVIDQGLLQQPHTNIGANKPDMSRRSSSESNGDSGSTALVDAMNRLRSSQQVSKSEMRSEPKRIESSPLLKLIQGFSRQNNTRNRVEGMSQQGPIQPQLGNSQPARLGVQPAAIAEAKFDSTSFNSSLDRIKLALAQFGRNRLPEPVRRASNSHDDQFKLIHRQAPLAPLGFDNTMPLEAGNGFAVSEFGLFNRLNIQADQGQFMQHPVYQPRMQTRNEAPQSLLAAMYPPLASLAPPQQVAETSNQMELIDHFNAFDPDTDRVGAEVPSTLVNRLFTNQRFLHLPFGGNLMTQ